jgi:lipopolysaccharide biosynthesis regulator YciM
VPLEPPDQQHWQAAAGYVELGMFLEADTELDKIDPFNRAAPEVLASRLAIYHGLKKWELMQEIAKRLAEFQPDDIQCTMHDFAGVCDPASRFDSRGQRNSFGCKIKVSRRSNNFL